MLPYIPTLHVGPVSSFGLLAMLGGFFGLTAGSRHAEKLGLDPARVRRMAICCGIGAMLGAHYLDLFLYQPGWSERTNAVAVFFNPFSGISSYGGLIGGTIGFFVFALSPYVKGVRLRYADAALVATVVLLMFGRAGCASAHDHIGVASRSALAVDFPAGNPSGVVGPHHDLGLYELMLFVGLATGMVVLLRRPRRSGWIVGVVAVSYAVPRFWFDFLRREVSDPRYAGLTPAQWCCFATVGAALAVFAWIHVHPQAPVPYHDATPWRVHLREALRVRRQVSPARS